MNIHVKRFLILFSITLNIGFIVSVFILHAHRPMSPYMRFSNYSKIAMKQLSIPSHQKEALSAFIKAFHEVQMERRYKFADTRKNLFAILAKPGPIDEIGFNDANDALLEKVITRHKAIQQHLFELRDQLGDENGAHFFSILLEMFSSPQKKSE